MKFKNVLVTGGSSGIGLDLAKAYAKQGANVAIVARDQGRIDTAINACQEASLSSDQKILGFSVDVGDAVALSNTVENIKNQMGALDLLILSAGIVQSIRFMEQSDEDFESIMRINVIGSRAVAKAFLPAMIEHRKGHICFVEFFRRFNDDLRIQCIQRI